MTIGAQYFLDEGTGTAVADSVGDADMAFQGSPTWTSDSGGGGVACGSADRVKLDNASGSTYDWDSVNQAVFTLRVNISGNDNSGQKILEVHDGGTDWAIALELSTGDLVLYFNGASRTYTSAYTFDSDVEHCFHIIVDTPQASAPDRITLVRDDTELEPSSAWDNTDIPQNETLIWTGDAFVILGAADSCDVWFHEYRYGEVLSVSQCAARTTALDSDHDADPGTGASGAISGTINATSTVSGTLAGEGALAAAENATSTVTGTLVGDGALQGTITATSAVTGDIAGKMPPGTAAGTSTVTGTLVGDGALQANEAATSTVTGTLVGDGSLQGTIAGTSTVTGTLVGDGALAAAEAATSTVTGTLVGDGSLQGTIAGTSTVTGTLVSGNLQGTINATSTVSGTLVGDGALAAAENATSTVTGTLVGDGALQGTIAATSTVTGTLVAGRLQGTIAATSTVTGTLVADGALVAVDAGVSTITGTLAAAGALQGTIAATSAVTGVLVGDGALQAIVDALSTSSGTLIASGSLQGTINALSTTIGTIEATGQLLSSVSASSTVTGTLISAGQESILLAGTQWEGKSSSVYFASSPIQTTTVPVTRSADVFFFPASLVPAELLNSKWQVRLRPYWTTADLQTGELHYLFYKNSNEFLSIGEDLGTVYVFWSTTAGVISRAITTTTVQQELIITVDFILGELTISGATTGNGTSSGLTNNWSTGTLYVGSTSVPNSHLFGAMSEPILIE